MASGSPSCLKVMQCHATPDTAPLVCVGFSVVVGPDSVGYRLAGHSGMLDPVNPDPTPFYRSVEAVLEAHPEHDEFLND